MQKIATAPTSTIQRDAILKYVADICLHNLSLTTRLIPSFEHLGILPLMLPSIMMHPVVSVFSYVNSRWTNLKIYQWYTL